MRYIAICTLADQAGIMAEVAGSRVARIPVLYTNPKTEYWISEEGDKAFVVRDIHGRMFIEEIKINTKKRTPGSGPYIRYRTNRNTQITLTVSRAVYGAFILKDTLPRHLPYHKDGDPLNCSLGNLESEEKEGRLQKNLHRYADDYIRHFARFTDYCQAQFAKERQDAEDIVSDAFIAVCEHRTEIRDILAAWMLRIQKRFKFRQYLHNHQSLDILEETQTNNTKRRINENESRTSG